MIIIIGFFCILCFFLFCSLRVASLADQRIEFYSSCQNDDSFFEE